MKHFIFLFISFFLVETLFAAGIQEKTDKKEVSKGKVNIFLTDHRVAVDDFISLVVVVDKIRLHKKNHAPEKGWIDVECEKKNFDLTQYKDGKLFQLVEVELPEGNYDAAELLISEAYGTPEGLSELAIPVDVGAFRIIFVVRAQQTLSLIFDLTVLDVSDHPGRRWLIVLKEIRKEAVG